MSQGVVSAIASAADGYFTDGWAYVAQQDGAALSNNSWELLDYPEGGSPDYPWRPTKYLRFSGYSDTLQVIS